MLRESRGALGPYWLICGCDDHEASAPDISPRGVLTLELAGHGAVLPIFGGEEEARRFAGAMALEPAEPGVVPVTRLRLVSALLDTLAGVDRVAFDPMPGPHLVETVEFASLCRGAFVDLLLGRGKTWSTRKPRLPESPTGGTKRLLQPGRGGLSFRSSWPAGWKG